MTETTQQTGMLATIQRKGEVAIAAMAAKARAEVEARFAIAHHRDHKRIINDVRVSILAACKRPAFARGAMYCKPVSGNKTVEGFSIRFAEEAIKSMGNIVVDTMTIYEDDERRTIHIFVTDLESNSTYGDEVTLSKTVERRQLKEGQMAISERMNSTGQKVFLIAATDDELNNKVNAAKSKTIRNSGLRLVPQDILEEAWDTITNTLEKGGEDPKAETKKVCDAFSTLGVRPAELEKFLGHPMDSVSPKELSQLRKMYTAIREEEATWAGYLAEREPKKPVFEGPGQDGDLGPQKAAAAVEVIDAALIEQPYKHILTLCERDGVNPFQVHAWMKSPKVKLCGEKTEDLIQASDPSLRTVIGTWATVLPKIKATKVPAT